MKANIILPERYHLRKVHNGDAVDLKILTAARELLFSMGMNSVTIAEIARQAGVSRPTIYRRYADVGNILLYILQSEVEELIHSIPRVKGTGLEQLVATAKAMINCAVKRGFIQRLALSEPALFNTYTMERLGGGQRLVHEAVIAPLVRKGQEDSSIREGDPDEMSLQVLFLSMNAVMNATIFSKELSKKRWLLSFEEILIGYLKKEERN